MTPGRLIPSPLSAIIERVVATRAVAGEKRPVYAWCDYCGERWEAEGLRVDRFLTEIEDGSDHNHRCERGGRYVDFAWTPAERERRQGELFFGDDLR